MRETDSRFIFFFAEIYNQLYIFLSLLYTPYWIYYSACRYYEQFTMLLNPSCAFECAKICSLTSWEKKI